MPLPVQEPLTLREIVAAHADALTGARLEMAALRRALDATKLSPGRIMSDAMLYAALNRVADYELETLKFARLVDRAARLSTWQEMFEAEQAAELAAVPEPVRHGHRKPRQARQPGTRSLRSLGAAVPAGAGLRAAFGGVRLPFLVGHKAALTAVAGGALTVAAISAMPPSFRLPDITGIGTWHAPAAVIWHAEPVTRLPSSLPTDAFIQPEKHPKPVVTLAAAPVLVPVVAAPEVTPSQPDPSYQSSTSSQTYQPSDQSAPSQPDQPSQWQAQGRHASQDSPEGDSSYRGRHDGGSQDGSQQDGSGHGAGWQNGQQQGGGWQNGNQQQGNQQGGHGQRGGH